MRCLLQQAGVALYRHDNGALVLMQRTHPNYWTVLATHGNCTEMRHNISEADRTRVGKELAAEAAYTPS